MSKTLSAKYYQEKKKAYKKRLKLFIIVCFGKK